MKFKNKIISLLVLLSATVLLQACGSGGDGSSSAATSSTAPATVSGVAATGNPILGRVYLKDSSGAVEQVADTDANGAYSFNIDGLKAPFLLRAVWENGTGIHALYSYSAGAGTANVNPLSHAAVVAAAGMSDGSALDQGLNEGQMMSVGENLPGVLLDLRAQLAPLLDVYGADADPISDSFKADHTGLDAMFDAVAIEVAGGQITVVNRTTADQIFVCATNNIQSGQMNPDNIPVGTPTPAPAPTPTPTPTPTPAPLPGKAIYDNECAGCHRLGTYDASGSPNLSGLSAAVSGMISGGHMGISLTTAEIADLQNFISQN